MKQLDRMTVHEKKKERKGELCTHVINSHELPDAIEENSAACHRIKCSPSERPAK